MGAERFLKSQVGLQTAHGTPVTPTIQVPLTGDYEDGRVFHSAPYDSGAWTPTTIRALVNHYATINVKGTAMFELLPVLLNSAYEDVAPSGADPYTHTYTINPAAVAVPKPTTWLVGAVGENLGATGPAVKIQDAYVESWALTGNMNSKEISLDAKLFGAQVDDNSGAGYAFASVGLPATLDVMKFLLGTFNIDDAGSSGGAFTTMTAFAGSLLGWKLSANTGLRPKWSGDSNSLLFSGITYGEPSFEFTPTIRTSATNYALVCAKFMASTYQELQIVIAGALTRALTVNLTGLWTACPTPHAREDGEVVMKPTFTAQTPHTQTTTPHYAAITVISKHNWT